MAWFYKLMYSLRPFGKRNVLVLWGPDKHGPTVHCNICIVFVLYVNVSKLKLLIKEYGRASLKGPTELRTQYI